MTIAAPPAPSSLELAAARLAALLTGGATGLSDASGRGDLEFEPVIGLRPLARAGAAPPTCGRSTAASRW